MGVKSEGNTAERVAVTPARAPALYPEYGPACVS